MMFPLVNEDFLQPEISPKVIVSILSNDVQLTKSALEHLLLLLDRGGDFYESVTKHLFTYESRVIQHLIDITMDKIVWKSHITSSERRRTNVLEPNSSHKSSMPQSTSNELISQITIDSAKILAKLSLLPSRYLSYLVEMDILTLVDRYIKNNNISSELKCSALFILGNLASIGHTSSSLREDGTDQSSFDQVIQSAVLTHVDNLLPDIINLVRDSSSLTNKTITSTVTEKVDFRSRYSTIFMSLSPFGNFLTFTPSKPIENVESTSRDQESSTDQLKLKRNSLWALTRLVSLIPHTESQYINEIILAVKSRIFDTQSDAIIDCCTILRSLMSTGSNVRIQMILDCGLAGRIVHLLSHSNNLVSYAAIQVSALIAFGSESQGQVLIDLNILQTFKHILSTSPESNILPRAQIQQAICWTLSNLVSNGQKHVQDIKKVKLFEILKILLESASFNVRKEIAFIIRNATCVGSLEQVRYLVEVAKVLEPLCNLLEYNDTNLILTVLLCIENILKCGHWVARRKARGTINPYIILMERCLGHEKLELLQISDNEQIVKKSVMLCTMYFEVKEPVARVRRSTSSVLSTSTARIHDNSDEESTNKRKK